MECGWNFTMALNYDYYEFILFYHIRNNYKFIVKKYIYYYIVIMKNYVVYCDIHCEMDTVL